MRVAKLHHGYLSNADGNEDWVLTIFSALSLVSNLHTSIYLPRPPLDANHGYYSLSFLSQIFNNFYSSKCIWMNQS